MNFLKKDNSTDHSERKKEIKSEFYTLISYIYIDRRYMMCCMDLIETSKESNRTIDRNKRDIERELRYMYIQDILSVINKSLLFIFI